MKIIASRFILLSAFSLSVALSSFAQAQDSAAAARDAGKNSSAAMNPAPADTALRPVLEDFRGEAGLKSLMDEFMRGLLADKRTQPFFENADQDMVKKHLTEQFCVILGGDCQYTGRDMRASHAQMGVTRTDFNALVEVLQVVMAKRGIPFRSQNKLLAKLAPMHRDIETR